LKTFLTKISICFFLFIATNCVYWQVRYHGPINADDFYLTTNIHINNAISYEGLLDAMTSLIAGVWMPLVYLSVGLQMELFGTDFGSYHLVSAVLHSINAVILFLLLFQITRAVWKSALVAAVFALHPINVEPVAWLACIRVIQSGFFCLLAIYFYSLCISRRSSIYYTLSLYSYGGSIFSVPMFPALPFLLLLLDYWPLGRLGIEGKDTSWQKFSLSKTGLSVWEKFPFFGGMAVLSAILLLSHDLSSSPGIEQYPVDERLFNALFSYVKYIQQILMPVNLAVFYPFPENFPFWKICGALFVLIAITVISLLYIRRYPFLTVGWLWFAGMMLPLSGIAQIGSQARADHYAYIPMIGLLIFICWGTDALIKKFRIPRAPTIAGSIIVLILLAFFSWKQASQWKNSVTLMAHSLKVTKNNYEAHNYLAQALASQGDLETAIHHFQQALSIKPDHLNSHINLANTWIRADNIRNAIFHFSRALEIEPDNARIHNNLGALYEKTHNNQAALFHYQQAVTINPEYAVAYDNLAVLEAITGDINDAITHFKQALLINQSAGTHFRLGMALNQAGRMEEAIYHLRQAIDIDPENRQYPQFLKAITQNKVLHKEAQKAD